MTAVSEVHARTALSGERGSHPGSRLVHSWALPNTTCLQGGTSCVRQGRRRVGN